MTTLRLHILGRVIRPVARYFVRRAFDPVVERARFARLARFGFIAPRSIARSPEPRFLRDGFRALWLGEAGAPRVILHFHGGAFVMGSPETHWKLAANLARAAKTQVFLPHYRLAPEHSLLETLEDARAAWDFLVAEGFGPAQIALGGDSAGGGIALSLLAELLAEGAAPGCAYFWSPYADQTFSGASARENAARDHFFPGERAGDLPALILGGLDPADPRVSPLFAAFPAPPPVLIQVAQDEILRDDSVRLAEKLRAAGGEVTLELQPDAPHVWHLFHGWFPEAGEAIDRSGSFVRRHLGG